MSSHAVTTPADIAVIGMSCRLPGAADPDEYWRNLREGIESIRLHSVEDLLGRGVPKELLDNPRYVRASAPLEGADTFDAAFFGYSPREAEVMDPQHRLFLQCSYTALEDAGYDPGRYDGHIGVYAGSTMNTYLPMNLMAAGGIVDVVGDLQVMIGNDKEYLASRVSYKLDLRGPSTVVQTACSTSLVAVHVAAQAILAGECDMALAGGSSVRMPLGGGYLHQPGGTSSPDGHCRAFDAQAGGSVVGTGVGVVVLKHLTDAVHDGDHIYAVIKGSAVNNDGASKVSFTAPSVLGQARAAAAALAAAKVDADQIGFVEAHGTGTPLGDPIEVAALTMAFRESTTRRQFCALGSVKTNIGHLDAAAGVAGFIKAVQVVRHGLIPPTLHFTTPNPQLKLESSPFYVNNEVEEFESDGSRLASVNSIGMGGTNAHVVVQQPPSPQRSPDAERHQLLTLSARTPTALETMTVRLARWLREHPSANLADVAFTLGQGRKELPYRRAVVVRDVEDAGYALEAPTSRRVHTRRADPPASGVAFLFPGQGTQYPGMARRRYNSSDVFRAAVDECLDCLEQPLRDELSDLLLARAATDEATARLTGTALAQPALFITEYANAVYLMKLGVQPCALLGHSVGEIVAAVVAGTLPLAAAVRLVALRGQAMAALPGGAMLGVALPEADAARYVGEGVEVAAVNGPALTTLAGPVDALDAVRRRLLDAGVAVQPLHVSHAFHTAMMEPALHALVGVLDGVELRTPAVPWVSNVTGTWITEADATDPAYWARHARATVRFADGAATVAEQPGIALVEVGPGATLASLAGSVSESWAVAVPTLGGPRDKRDDRATLLDGLGALWSAGVALDWSALWEGGKRLRVALPTYPFEPKRYWLQASDRSAEPQRLRQRDDERLAAQSDWWFSPVWTQLTRVTATGGAAPSLVVDAGAGELADRLAAHLATGRRRVTQVDADADDAVWDSTLDRVRQDGPVQVVVLLGSVEDLGAALRPVVAAVRALHRGGVGELVVVTVDAFDARGDEKVDPAHAAAHTASWVLHQEAPGLRARGVDLDAAGLVDTDAAAALLAAELNDDSAPPVVALRGGRRWARDYRAAAAPVTTAPAWRPGGVYAVIGGLGFFGRTAARHLLASLGAHVVLVDRDAEPVDPRVRADLDDLRGLGGTLTVVGCDAADEQALRAVLAGVHNEHGRIDAVLFASGPPASEGIAELHAVSGPVLGPHVAARVEPLRALAAALVDVPAGAVVVASSLGTVLGGIASAAYTATSLWAEAFASAQPGWTTVSWEHWRTPGEMSLGSARERYALDGAELAQTIETALRHGPDRLAVSTAVLGPRIARARASQRPAPDGAAAAEENDGRSTRPATAGPYQAPRDERERFITENMAQLLGIDKVGIRDNFFDDLDGDSLMAMQLVSRMRDHFRVDLPMSDLFQGATAAELAAKLALYQDGEKPQRSAVPDPEAAEIDALLADAAPEDLERLLEELEDGR